MAIHDSAFGLYNSITNCKTRCHQAGGFFYVDFLMMTLKPQKSGEELFTGCISNSNKTTI